MKLILGWLTEIFIALVIYPIAVTFGRLLPMYTVSSSAPRTNPIVFVHGWLGCPPFYWLLKQRLEANGFRVLLTDFGFQTGDINRYIQSLRKFIDTQELTQFTLVGVSEGALISLGYLQQCNGWAKVSRFISIGGPFYGSPMAYLMPFSLAARQMRPGSHFLKSLLSAKIEYPERIVCVSAKHDELVPQWSSQLSGVKHVVLDITGHISLPIYPTTSKLIAQYAA